MSPTVFREKGYRFFFFSLEEKRMHIHVRTSHGLAKFWLEPEISVAEAKNIPTHQLNEIKQLVEEHDDLIQDAWHEHFGDRCISYR